MKLAGLLGYSSLITFVITSSVAEAQSSTETYSYDALGRLVSVVTAGGQNNGEAHTICYDDAGNRTQYVSDTSGIPASCTGGGTALLSSPLPSAPSGAAQSSDIGGDYTLAGDAAVPSDFQQLSSPLAFASGQAVAAVSVPTTDNLLVE